MCPLLNLERRLAHYRLTDRDGHPARQGESRLLIGILCFMQSSSVSLLALQLGSTRLDLRIDSSLRTAYRSDCFSSTVGLLLPSDIDRLGIIHGPWSSHDYDRYLMPKLTRRPEESGSKAENACPRLNLEAYLGHGAVWTVYAASVNTTPASETDPSTTPLVAKLTSPGRYPLTSCGPEEWDQASISGAVYDEVLAYEALSAQQVSVIPRVFGAWAGLDLDGTTVWLMLLERVGDHVVVEDLDGSRR